jgi:hypothetical protein
MSPELRNYLRQAISDARRQATAPPSDLACIGCGRDLRNDGYTLGCGKCCDRSRGRRRRGNPDGWRFINPETGSGLERGGNPNAGIWRFRDEWKETTTDPYYEPEHQAKANAARRRRRRLIVQAEQLSFPSTAA